MNILLFLIVIIISFITVRIGAVAFELTGLEWSFAKFQALSCFTGTGFTTREAELITGNPQRRRIASILMVLGNAGFVTLIATFANSLRPNAIMPYFTIPILHSVVPSGFLPWINLAMIAFAIYVISKFFTNYKVTMKFTDFVRARFLKRRIIRPVSFEELIVTTGGYGVSQIEVCKDSPVLNKSLIESHLKEHDIMVLAIERKGEIISNPSADTKIVFGDKLICFGRLGNIRKKLCVIPE